MTAPAGSEQPKTLTENIQELSNSLTALNMDMSMDMSPKRAEAVRKLKEQSEEVKNQIKREMRIDAIQETKGTLDTLKKTLDERKVSINNPSFTRSDEETDMEVVRAHIDDAHKTAEQKLAAPTNVVTDIVPPETLSDNTALATLQKAKSMFKRSFAALADTAINTWIQIRQFFGSTPDETRQTNMLVEGWRKMFGNDIGRGKIAGLIREYAKKKRAFLSEGTEDGMALIKLRGEYGTYIDQQVRDSMKLTSGTIPPERKEEYEGYKKHIMSSKSFEQFAADRVQKYIENSTVRPADTQHAVFTLSAVLENKQPQIVNSTPEMEAA